MSLQEHSCSRNRSDDMVIIDKLQSRGLAVHQICPEPLQSCFRNHHFLPECISTSHTEPLLFLIHKDTYKFVLKHQKEGTISSITTHAKSCGSLQRPHGLVNIFQAHTFASLDPILSSLITYLKRSRRRA